MELTLRPTDQIVSLESRQDLRQGVEARIWEGYDEQGYPVVAFISRLAVHQAEPPEVHERFARELNACDKPKPSHAWDLRFFID